MMQLFYRHLLLPAFEGGLKRRKTFHYYRDLERSQWLPNRELRERQFAALKRLLNHAAANCAYYARDWAQRSLAVDRLRTLDEFHAWPIIDREVIRANRMALHARVPRFRLYSKSTGGSSGVPLHFELDTDSNDRRTAAWYRGYGWAGAAPGTRQFYLWGVPLGTRSWSRRCKDRLYDALQRRRSVNCFELSDTTAPEIARHMRRYRPDALVAYTGAAYAFARALREQRIVAYQPRAVIVGAEQLHAFQRRLIEEVFQAPVFETYGSREFMLIGAECNQHQGLHVTMENLLVEVLDLDGLPTPSGREGNVVVTDLTNYGMPFVRYATGDRALAGEAMCPCGRGLPLLARVTGRRLDVLTTPDGRSIPGEFFPHLLKDYAEVRRYQVVQESSDRVVLRIVLAGGWSPGGREQVEAESRRVLGPEMQFELVCVSEIPLTSSGKLQVVVNRASARSQVAVSV